ncbi:MAG TPA: hypothetical protein GX736_03390 [Mogibacterium sp.]|nr:hypothetical protein [Mogibacterium sp.]
MKAVFKRTIPFVLSVMLVIVGLVPTINVNADNLVEHELRFQKILSKAYFGVATPYVTFNFSYTKHSFGGNETQASKDKLPDLNPNAFTVAYTPADVVTSENINGAHMKKLSDDLLDGVSFTEVGQYTYLIKEEQPTGIDPGPAAVMHASEAQYLVSIFVIDKGGGTYVVDKIVIGQTVRDDGTAIAEPSKTVYALDNVAGTSNLIFQNQYRPRGGTDLPQAGLTPSAAELKGFVLMKEVTGTATGNETSPFPFTIYLDPPWGLDWEAEQAAGHTPTYRIVDKDGVVETQNHEIPYKTLTSIQLRHNERLVLNDVMYGTFIRVDETSSLGYVKSFSGWMDGKQVNGSENLAGYGINIGETSGTSTTGNYIKFTNNQQTATGFIFANLPFIIISIVAAGGIILFVRSRRRAYEE